MTRKTHSWSPQQDAALIAVSRWFADARHKRAPQVFRLFGYAGTGKTTLAKEIARAIGGTVLFGAFTGKAAHVLRQKGCWDAKTIHSMIYHPDDDERREEEPRFILNPDSDVAIANLVIIDEVSMVDEALGRDLLSFGTPVLVLGDPAQLPPVKGEGYFTAAEPDCMLTEVHRQARESAIIRLATTIREGGRAAPCEETDLRIIPRASLVQQDVLKPDQILVGLNRTRFSYNARVRQLLGRLGETPAIGDRLVCLRNNKTKHLFNGSLWTVKDVPASRKPDRVKNITRLHVVSEDDPARQQPVSIGVRNEFWSGGDSALQWQDKKGTDEFTYGYALTCHKAQGSQWDDVIVFDEAASFRDDAWRWRYTAFTRAAKRLTVVLL